MAKTRKESPASRIVTTQRAARLYRLLQLLARGPQPRDVLTRRLGLNIRGFYRDLETLQHLGTPITLTSRGYRLTVRLNAALALLPFPDPGLTFAEALQLAKGRGSANRKLKLLIARMVK